ncbi:hypothetical protein V2O64_14070 [Verrucomicrobiaceae bacterium 227]
MKLALGLIVSAVLLFGYWLLARKFRGEVFVEMRTGNEKTFELEEGQPLEFHDVNTGLGSAPAKIDSGQGYALYQPNGERCELDRSVGEGYYFGDFEAPVAGTYRFVLDELEDVQSRGALIGHDTLPFRNGTGWAAIWCFVFSGPLAFLGGLLWILAPKGPPPPTSSREDVMQRFEGRK